MERILELLDLGALLLPLLVEAVGALLGAVAAGQGGFRQVVIPLFDGQLGLALPFVGLLLADLVALLEPLLIGDRGRDLGLDLHELVVHVDEQLPNDLFRILGSIEHVVDIGAEQG